MLEQLQQLDNFLHPPPEAYPKASGLEPQTNTLYIRLRPDSEDHLFLESLPVSPEIWEKTKSLANDMGDMSMFYYFFLPFCGCFVGFGCIFIHQYVAFAVWILSVCVGIPTVCWMSVTMINNIAK